MRKRIWKIAAVLLFVIDLYTAMIEIFTYVASIGGWIPDPINLKTYKTFSMLSYRYSKQLIIAGGIVLLINAAFIFLTFLMSRKKSQ